MNYETVIGLEVHLQLATRTKAFCACSTEFGRAPNSQTCPVCLGFPGSLPVLNEEAFKYAVKVALALNCAIQETIKFDRKNYYYPDLPKNFQISQYDMPLSYDGFLEVQTGGEADRRKIRIKRVHLEEDAGKLIHHSGHSLVDYNRAGVPLLEIVTEPDLRTPQEAYDYLTSLKAVLEYLRVSDCDMEKGSLRCDANISVRPEGDAKLGTKVELKNMNTFKGVKSSLEYEAGRQLCLVRSGGTIVQETRLWDADRSVTTSMRTKEEATDYRYFPEPDLVPFVVDASAVEQIRSTLPELPETRRRRFVLEFGLSEYDAGVITGRLDTAEYFEECARIYDNRKAAANWIMGEIAAYMNDMGLTVAETGLSAESLVGLLKMIDSGTISGKMAKEVLAESFRTKTAPGDIVAKRSMAQISDEARIEEVVIAVMAENGKSVADYRSGKKSALAHLVGQVMRRTKGSANPAVVNAVLKKRLGE
jgi:aspartyl-tRNA(Asn)/glutamyl-tRNA(Gln) amidotransferase subunit B